MPRVLSLPKPRAPLHSRRKREGREELCRNPPKPEHFPAAEQSPWKSLLHVGPLTHMKAAFFWANYTGCSEPPGRIQAAKADIKGLPTNIQSKDSAIHGRSLPVACTGRLGGTLEVPQSTRPPPREDKRGRGAHVLFAWQAPSRTRQRAGLVLAGPTTVPAKFSEAFI